MYIYIYEKITTIKIMKTAIMLRGMFGPEEIAPNFGKVNAESKSTQLDRPRGPKELFSLLAYVVQ